VDRDRDAQLLAGASAADHQDDPLTQPPARRRGGAGAQADLSVVQFTGQPVNSLNEGR
jgi:hypothetical protein